MTNFIVEKRLQWTEMEPEDTTPFGNPSTGSICYIAVFLIFFSAGVSPVVVLQY